MKITSMSFQAEMKEQENEDEKKQIDSRKDKKEIKNAAIEPVEIKMGWDGIESYTCVMCAQVYKDLGLHLCVSHGMVKCRTDRRCKLFFGSLADRESHETFDHRDSPYLFPISCQKCKDLKFSDQFDLVCHRFNYHQMLTCTLCRSITNGTNGFEKHLDSHKLDDTLKTSGFLEFISRPILTINKDTKKLECNLCVQGKVSISAEENGQEFLQHFRENHAISKPSDNLFKLFNGENFNFKNLCDKFMHTIRGIKRPTTSDSMDTNKSKKPKVSQGNRPSVIKRAPSKPMKMPEQAIDKAEPTGKLTSGTIAGSAIGCSKSAGNLPSFHLSKKPVTPFIRWSMSERENVKKELGMVSVSGMGPELRKRWAALSSDTKQIYQDKYDHI